MFRTGDIGGHADSGVREILLCHSLGIIVVDDIYYSLKWMVYMLLCVFSSRGLFFFSSWYFCVYQWITEQRG